MLPSELLEDVRLELDDLERDFLHSDTAIYIAMENAQREMAIYTECMYGDVPVTLQDMANIPENVFHPKCVVYNNKAYDLYHGRAPIDTLTGTPRAFYHADDVIEVYPAQTVDINIMLRAVLIPKEPPSEDNDNFEIQEAYHRILTPGVVYYCLRCLDADVKDYQKVREWKAAWNEALKEAYNLTALRTRRRGTVRYGGY